MMSRLSGHLMRQLQMEDFVVSDWVGYEKIAVKLGNSPILVDTYKERMAKAQQTSLLFDADAFAKDFSRALIRAVEAS